MYLMASQYLDTPMQLTWIRFSQHGGVHMISVTHAEIDEMAM